MPLPLIAAGVIAAAGLAKTYIGARQEAKARKMAAANTRPTFDIAEEYFTNQRLAQSQAQSGLGQQSLDFYADQAARGLSAGTDAILQTGGGPNAIGGLYSQYNQGVGQIAAANSQAQQRNIANLMDQNARLAEQRTMQWSLNQYEPYKDTARTASALQATGTQNIFNGISQVGSAVGAYANSGLYKNSIYQNPQNNADTAVTHVLPNATVGNVPASSTYSGQLGTPSMDTQSLINDSLEGMENSPYRDLIRRRLEEQYGRMNPSTIG
jgi:hypothetical protein